MWVGLGCLPLGGFRVLGAGGGGSVAGCGAWGWVGHMEGKEWFLYGGSGEDKVREGTGGGRSGVYPCSWKGEGPIGGQMDPHWPDLVHMCIGMAPSLLFRESFVESTRWPSTSSTSTVYLCTAFMIRKFYI